MDEVKISIYTPVYNAEKYLENCLDSICAQTVTEIELFLYDDGSTDSSYEICRKYAEKDSRIILQRGENGTSIIAMNEFVRNSSGKYIAFVDNDDYLEDDYLEKLYRKAESTGADCAVGSYTLVDSEGKILPWYSPELTDGELLTGTEACRRFLTTLNIEGFRWNKLYKRSVFLKSGVEFKEHQPADIPAEFDLLSSTDKVVMVQSRGYYYRQSSSSYVATVAADKLLCFLETFSDITEKALNKGLHKEAWHYYNWRCINSLFNAIKNRSKYIESDWKRICKICAWNKIFKMSFWKTVHTLFQYDNERDGRLKFFLKAVIVRCYFHNVNP